MSRNHCLNYGMDGILARYRWKVQNLQRRMALIAPYGWLW